MRWLLSDVGAQYIYIGVAIMYFFRFSTRFLEWKVSKEPEWVNVLKRWMPFFAVKDALIVAVVLFSVAITGSNPYPAVLIRPWIRSMWVCLFLVLSVGTIGELTQLTILWWKISKREITDA